MDYSDFMQQAEVDLDRSQKAFNEKDFSMSSFWCQQGFEKYLKAYFLKCNIFDNPVELRHSAYPKIVDEVISYMSDPKIRNQNDPQVKSALKFLHSLYGLLMKIESNDQIKIMCWKSSLEIPFTKTEKNIDVGLGIKFISNFKNMVTDTQEWSLSMAKILTDIDFSTIDRTKLDERSLELLDLLISIVRNTLDITKLENINESSKELQKNSARALELIGYGSGKDSLSKNDTKNITKLIDLTKSFDWISSGVNVYPHESISRYPILIDGKLSTDLYFEYSSTLSILIQNVRKTCDEIRQSLL